MPIKRSKCVGVSVCAWKVGIFCDHNCVLGVSVFVCVCVNK